MNEILHILVILKMMKKYTLPNGRKLKNLTDTAEKIIKDWVHTLEELQFEMYYCFTNIKVFLYETHFGHNKCIHNHSFSWQCLFGIIVWFLFSKVPTCFLCLSVFQKCRHMTLKSNGSLKTFTCTTNGSSCTTGIGNSTVRIDFCITIIAHIGNINITSKRRCQPGRREGEAMCFSQKYHQFVLFFQFTLLVLFFSAILPAVTLNSAEPVHGSPECLTVSWSRENRLFFVSDSEIKDLNSQIEFKALEQVSHPYTVHYTKNIFMLKANKVLAG